MIYSEVQGTPSPQPHRLQFPSEAISLQPSNSKKSSDGILHSLEVTQSRMTEHLQPRVDKGLLPLKEEAKTDCEGCEMWEEWALESQQSILKIQKKLIERQKALHDKFMAVKKELEAQAKIFENKERMYKEQNKRDKKVIKQLNSTIQQLKIQIKNLSYGRKSENKSNSSKNYSVSYVVQQEEDENQEQIQTAKKGDGYQRPLQQIAHEFPANCPSRQFKVSNQHFYQETAQAPKNLKLTDNTQDKLGENVHQKNEKLSLKRQLMLNFNNQKGDTGNPSRFQGNQLEGQALMENISVQFQAGMTNLSHNKGFDLCYKASNPHSRPKERTEPKNTPQTKENSLKKLSTIQSRQQLDPQITQKTIKLNNHHVNVQKSRFAQTVTECSFLNDAKSRTSHVSYKLPIDEYTTVISHSDEKYGGHRRNPERLETQNDTKTDSGKINEQMQRLQFENENLKSYNRVLLQKLSNSRPKKY